ASPDHDVEDLVARPPIYWDRAAPFVTNLPLPQRLLPLYDGYLYDATNESQLNHCRFVNEDKNASAIFIRYCGYLISLEKVPNVETFHNLRDLQYISILRQLSLIRVHEPWTAEDLNALKSFGVEYVAGPAGDGPSEKAIAHIPTGK